MADKNTIPPELRAPNLLHPVFRSLIELGGSGKNEEIVDKVIELQKFSEKLVNRLHSNTNPCTELEYGCAWARTFLKKAGLIESSERGVWTIASKYIGLTADKLPTSTIIVKAGRTHKTIEELLTEEKASGKKTALSLEDMHEMNEEDNAIPAWKEQLLPILKNMNPYAFEFLSQRLLRECGFENVRVTKKSGDGGIDGLAILKINGIFSFSIAFQCKRYDGKVGAPAIRDFRGSLASDIEKGVFITTGLFTAEAKAEAFAPGKKQIDLVDGNAFMDKLAEYQIGLKEVIKKDYEIDNDFFAQFKNTANSFINNKLP